MKKATKFLVPLLLALLILASIVWYLFIYDRAFTRDALLGQARFQDEHGNSKMSSWFYDAAYSFSGHDDNVAIELANQYRRDGNFTKAEYTLTQAITSNPTAEGYTALCKTYVLQDKLLDAVRLLDSIPDPQIKEQLDKQRPQIPVADHPAGFYSQYMDVRLSSNKGTVYYSTDGSYPSTAGSVCEDVICLEAGETVITAISVSDEGLVSPVTQLTYTITGVIEEVTFADPILESAIRTAIGAGSDRTVMSNELWDVTEFTVPAGASQYGDLALLPNVAKLTFEAEKLASLSFLAGLEKLETLDLTGCGFPAEELKHLTALPALKTLILANCGLSTIADLSGAIALYTLDLSGNTIRNLDALATMVTLREINLQHNAVTDLSALSGLMELQTLDISYNAVNTVKPLATCAKLSTLNASHNQIPTLNGLEALSQLRVLDVSSNQLPSVMTLAKMPELTHVDLSSNQITDISYLNVLTKLEEFRFSSNQIGALPAWPEDCPLQIIDGSYNALTSLDGLKNMDSLTHVYMDYNLITNIDALEDCFCLVQINVFGNEIKDVSKLREHDIIVNYDPTYAMDKD